VKEQEAVPSNPTVEISSRLIEISNFRLAKNNFSAA